MKYLVKGALTFTALMLVSILIAGPSSIGWEADLTMILVFVMPVFVTISALIFWVVDPSNEVSN